MNENPFFRILDYLSKVVQKLDSLSSQRIVGPNFVSSISELHSQFVSGFQSDIDSLMAKAISISKENPFKDQNEKVYSFEDLVRFGNVIFTLNLSKNILSQIDISELYPYQFDHEKFQRLSRIYHSILKDMKEVEGIAKLIYKS